MTLIAIVSPAPAAGSLEPASARVSVACGYWWWCVTGEAPPS